MKIKNVKLALLLAICLSCSKEDEKSKIILVAPADIKLNQKDENVLIEWKQIDISEVNYSLERKTDNTSFSEIALIKNEQSYLDTSVLLGRVYYYRLKVILSEDQSEYSKIVTINTSFNQPSKFSITPLSKSKVLLKWNDDYSFESGFRVERSSNGIYSTIAILNKNIINYCDSNLDTTMKYSYRIKAFTAKNESSYSNMIRINWNYAKIIEIDSIVDSRLGNIYTTKYSPDGNFLVTANDGDARMYQTSDYSEVKDIDDANWMSSSIYSPDGSIIACQDQYRITLLNASTGIAFSILIEHPDFGILSIKFSKDGKFLAAGCSDGSVRLWDVYRKKLVWTLSGHFGYVCAIAFSPDGKYLACGDGNNVTCYYCYDAYIRIWNLETGEKIKEILVGRYSISSLMYSNDGQNIFCGTRFDNNELFVFNKNTYYTKLVGEYMIYNSNSEVLASVKKDSLFFFDAESLINISNFVLPGNYIRDIDFSKKNDNLVTSSSDRVIRIWKFEKMWVSY